MTIMKEPVVTRCLIQQPDGVDFGDCKYPKLMRGELYIIPQVIAQELQIKGIVEILEAKSNDNKESTNQ